MSAPELTLTIAGFVARNAEIRYTQAGTPVAQASVPYTPRRRTPDGRWEDAGETVWVDVKVWQKDAEKFAQLATKGTYLAATGHLDQPRRTAPDVPQHRRPHLGHPAARFRATRGLDAGSRHPRERSSRPGVGARRGGQLVSTATVLTSLVDNPQIRPAL